MAYLKENSKIKVFRENSYPKIRKTFFGSKWWVDLYMGLTYTQVNTLHNTLLNGAFTNSGCLTIIMMQHQAIYLLLTRCMQGYNFYGIKFCS